MDKNLEKLHVIDLILAKLVDGNNLNTEETEKLIFHIFLYDTEGYHLATFIGAIHAKGETEDELLGFLNATKSLTTKIDLGIDSNKVTDLSGTGGGKFKSINVSTTASFIVAGAGYTVAKESYFASTSPTGSADVFTALGVDFFKLNKKQIEQTLKEIGICPVITPFISPRLTNRGKIVMKFFVERQIGVLSPFHLVSNLQLPLIINHRIYGCYSSKYLDVFARLFRKMAYKKTLTFYADIGMPEISNVGYTTIVEQNGQKIKKYIIKAKDLGIKEANAKDIKTNGKVQNIFDFVNILKCKNSGPKADLAIINAAAALFALEDVKTLKEGVNKAKQILNDGKAYLKLEKLIKRIGNLDLLKKFES